MEKTTEMPTKKEIFSCVVGNALEVPGYGVVIESDGTFTRDEYSTAHEAVESGVLKLCDIDGNEISFAAAKEGARIASVRIDAVRQKKLADQEAAARERRIGKLFIPREKKPEMIVGDEARAARAEQIDHFFSSRTEQKSSWEKERLSSKGKKVYDYVEGVALTIPGFGQVIGMKRELDLENYAVRNALNAGTLVFMGREGKPLAEEEVFAGVEIARVIVDYDADERARVAAEKRFDDFTKRIAQERSEKTGTGVEVIPVKETASLGQRIKARLLPLQTLIENQGEEYKFTWKAIGGKKKEKKEGEIWIVTFGPKLLNKQKKKKIDTTLEWEVNERNFEEMIASIENEVEEKIGLSKNMAS